MFREKFAEFLRDEDGGYVIWGLLWFILYVGIGGLAVDITDAFRTQSTLQATADAAALAGILSPLDDETEVDAQAMIYATRNMSQNVHGTVLRAEDVQIGRWDFDNRTFTLGGSNPNAVRAVTRRAATNQNPLATNFLRIAGFGSFDVSTEAIAALGVNTCRNNGIIACGELDFNPWTRFVDNICLIGEQGLSFRQRETSLEEGVYAAAGCQAGDRPACVGPGGQVWRTDGLASAFNLGGEGGGNYGVNPGCPNAENVSGYMDAVLAMAVPEGVDDLTPFDDFADFVDQYNDQYPLFDFTGYNYLSENYDYDETTHEITAGDLPTLVSGAALPTDAEGNAALQPYHVYSLNCPNSGYSLPPGDYTNVAVIANCPLDFTTGDYTMTNSLIAARPNGGSNTHAINAPNGANISMGGGCTGRNEIYAVGDVHFAASGVFANVRFLVDGDASYAGQTGAPVGISAETTGDFDVAAGAAPGTQFGGCPGSPAYGGQVLETALVH